MSAVVTVSAVPPSADGGYRGDGADSGDGADGGDGALLQVRLTTAEGTGAAELWAALPAHRVDGALREVLADLVASWDEGPQDAFDAGLHDRRHALAALLAEASAAGSGEQGPEVGAVPDAVIAAVSIASVRARAATAGVDPYRWMARTMSTGHGPRVPLPGALLVRGGRQAANRLEIAGVGVTPLGARSLRGALHMTEEVHGALRRDLRRLGFAATVEPGGSLEPAVQAPEDVLDLVVDAIVAAGQVPGAQGMAIEVDLAAGGLHAGGTYRLNGTIFDVGTWVEYLAHLVERYPIWSIRDATAADDHRTWAALTEAMADRVQLVGDAALVGAGPGGRFGGPGGPGGPYRGTAAEVSVEVSGTVTGAARDARHARAAGHAVVVAVRRRAVADDFLADLSVAFGCGHVRAAVEVDGRPGAVSRRLLQVADDRPELPFSTAST